MNEEILRQLLEEHEESYLGGFTAIPKENYPALIAQIIEEWP